ncbi:ATP-binding protein [Dokdonia sp. Hel_I_53]|uniref:ATP-binding protein n=1 Tax=Dokdonia sp. Hel_I_53 TaxID=1566287 RepID=UPI00119C4FE5|nr:ATP-binding protein [Dokdonia sp. Hel_I_53]TVZ53326.1 multi-sensor signal transduction histidine kinase [Dokdonia sp. Hel_I_53]
MESPSSLYPKTVDLTNCDKEPIHILGYIQSHGMLIVFDKSSFEIERVSENVLNNFSRKRDDLLQSNLFDSLTIDEADEIKSYINKKETYALELTIEGFSFNGIVHYDNDLVYLELEGATLTKNREIPQSHLSDIVSELSDATDVAHMCDEAAVLIKNLLNYDRVMIYQFDENWNGKVISEARDSNLESWLNMSYPATDIPQQARKLFLKQGVRIIVDVNDEPVKVVPELDVNDKPLDLSRCELRAVSPIHIEYLKNMEVGATLTAAIISNGELWGLIACHHYSPKFISYYKRLSIKFLTQVFSTQLTLRDSNRVLGKVNEVSKNRGILVEQMSNGWDVHSGLTTINGHTLLSINESTGGAILLEDKLSVVGETPEEKEIQNLIDWIYNRKDGVLFHSKSLPKEYDAAVNFSGVASGVLCLFFSENKKDCLLWFKKESKQTISWAGNPDKPVDATAGTLSPRKSFEKWNEEQVHTSESWKDYEIASAKALRENISSVILNKYEEVKSLNDKLNEAYKDLETFSYSVSHDLRSPLRGIDGFAQIIKEDYYDTLDDFGKSAIERIINSSNKMNALIDDILEFSTLGKEEIKFITIHMGEVVSEVIDFIDARTAYPDTQIDIQENFPEVKGDKTMLFQLWNNLISNALKYSSKSENAIVEIGFEEKEDSIVFYVKDNGIGFDSKHSEKIFGVFNRLVSEEYQGTGIGLSIVKRVIDRHNGTIWSESEVGVGTTFYFKLPSIENYNS